jgi:MerR family copper efflux transcriptional regulator
MMRIGEAVEVLGFRENPQKARPTVRELAHQKLTEVEQHLHELSTLRDELRCLPNPSPHTWLLSAPR